MSIADKLTTIAQNEQKVFDAGYNVGYSAGQEAGGGGSYDNGFADGRQAEYDSFWDTLQRGGSRPKYDHAFFSSCWTDTNYKPKYTIKPTSAEYMLSEALITDTKVDIDFSNITTTKTIDRLFSACSHLTTVKKIITNENIVYSNWFPYCGSLENITFEGVIAQNGLNLKWSANLSKASIESVINALSSSTNGLSVTFSLEAVKKAFETSEGALDGNTSSQWLTLIAAKPNWSIALIDKNGNKYTYDNDYIE